MKFSIPLPTDPLYCPKLSCAVYDYIFKGWNQPMIGVFVVPIGELMMSLQVERETELKKITDINKELENIMDRTNIPYSSSNTNTNANNSINSGKSKKNKRVDKSIAYDR
jgi:hypothetical protein